MLTIFYFADLISQLPERFLKYFAPNNSIFRFSNAYPTLANVLTSVRLQTNQYKILKSANRKRVETTHKKHSQKLRYPVQAVNTLFEFVPNLST